MQKFDYEPTREIIYRVEKIYRRRAFLAMHLVLYTLWCAPVLIEVFTFVALVDYWTKISLFNGGLLLLPTVIIHLIWHAFFEMKENTIRREIRAYRQGYADALHVQDSYVAYDNRGRLLDDEERTPNWYNKAKRGTVED